MAVIGHTEARATSASMTATALSSAPSALAAPTATLPFPLPLPPPSCERPRGRLRSADADFRTGTYPSPPPSSVSSAQSFRSLQSSRSHPVRMNSRPVFIDNTTRVYIPVHLPCGVEVRCCPDVFKSAPLVLRSLQIDLSQCLKVLPWSVHHLIRRTRIWLNNSYVYGDLHNPNMLRHTTTHHDETWLVECAHDIPEKACDVEIYNCMDYEQTRLHWNGCGLILHELCHVLHQHVLEDGLDNESVMAAFDTAKKSGLYNQCLRRDWAGQAEDTDTAYAMVDHKEFFAEMSVAYLCKGYKHTNDAGWASMEDASPPLIHPIVADRVMRWNRTNDAQSHNLSHTHEQRNAGQQPQPKQQPYQRQHKVRAATKTRLVDQEFQESALVRGCRDIHHCNKFFPFTRHQLQAHDKESHDAIRRIWMDVSKWNDNEEACFNIARGLNHWIWKLNL